MSGSSFRRLPCVIAVAMLTLVLGAAPASATLGPWGGQLSFHPSLPAAPPPKVTASPATNLLDRQLTRVRAAGFNPGSNVVVQECKVKVPPTSDPAFCDRGTSQFTRADFTGAVDASIPVHRVVRVANGRADCVTTPNGCEARVMATAYYGDPVPGGESGAASIAFDPSVAPPPPPSLAVDPTTGLADGQVVHVTGAGFTPGAEVAVLQCRGEVAKTRSPNDCDFNTLRFVPAGATGAFATDLTVHARLSTGTGTVDCVTATLKCVVNAAAINDFNESAAVSVSFTGTAPPPPPPATVAVAPSTGLVDRQFVQVTGSGFPADNSVEIVECKAKNPPSDDFALCDFSASTYSYADGTGHTSAALTVKRVITIKQVRVDCALAASGCEVRAIPYAGTPARAPIAFDPSQPPPPAPTVVALPNQALVDRQQIDVDGAHFTPNTQVGVIECRGDAVSPTGAGCDFSTLRYAPTDGSGAFATALSVRRVLHTSTGRYDCALEAKGCTAGAGTLSNYGENASAPLTFDPAVPAQRSTLAATPGTGLVDRQLVRVTGTKWTPLTTLFVQQCKVKDPPTRDPRYCDPSTTTLTQADIGGGINVTTEAHRTIFTVNGRVDCATTANGCQLRATTGYPYGGSSTGDTAVANLAFDSSVAPPGPPGVRVEPGQLADHQLAFVLGSNLPPGAYLEVEECRSGFDGRWCDESTAQFVRTDIAGGFGIAVGVKRTLATESGAVDCLQGFGCEMRASLQSTAFPGGGTVILPGPGWSWLPSGTALPPPG